TTYRCLYGLIIDAGIRHGDAELDEGLDRAPLEVEHRGSLPQHAGLGEIGAARVRDGRNSDPTLPLVRASEAFQVADAGFTETLGVGHDVCLRHRHEVCGAEELADADLVAQGLLRHRPLPARQNLLFLVVQLHAAFQSIVAPESRTALPHLASSRR